MSETLRIIEAVAQLWSEGPALFGARWEEVKQQLLLKLKHLDSHPAEDKTTVDELLAILEPYPDANERLVTLLAPAEMLKGAYKPLPGRQDAISASRFKCPEEGCEFSWSRRVARQRPPKCPQHHLPPVPAGAD
jgi:hypothetical protein